MGSEPAAPAVAVVVVASDPGEWFEESLSCLAAQDYDNFSVEVVDASAGEGVASRVARALPSARVLRVLAATSYAEAADQAVSRLEATAHVLICHDDVALAPDSLRLLVEEAYRRNGGVTCPKLVRWDAPERLLSVGLGADHLGVCHPLVEPGELDQGQHDAAREVFVAPSAALLVRTDLWRALGGFEPSLGSPGEDLDLSWRAHLAGARVVVAPQARARHLEALASGARARATRLSEHEDRREANRLRTLWTCYGLVALLLVVPATVLSALVEATWKLARHRRGREVLLPLSAFGGSLRRPRLLWQARRRAQSVRRASDVSIWKAQSKGSARLRSILRTRLERGHQLAWAAAHVASPQDGAVRSNGATSHPSGHVPAAPSWKVALALGLGLGAVLLIGSRHALFSDLPMVGQLPSTVGGVSGWWRAWWTGPGVAGLGGRPGPLPGAFVLGLVGLLAGGSASVAAHYLVFGPFLVGLAGAYVESGPFASQRGRVAATVVYAALPLPYDAIADGHLGGLVAYAISPWLIGQLGRLSATPPYDQGPAGRTWARFVALGLLCAAAGAITPGVLVLVVMVGCAMAAGSALLGQGQHALRLLSSMAATTAVAWLVLLPWSAGLLRSWSALIGPLGPTGGVSVGALLRFDTGPLGGGPLAWAIVVAGGVCLLIGRSWRFAWGVRLWAVAMALWGLAWAGGQGWLRVPETELLLAPAGAAVALAAALGVASVESDLSGYRFGWRQFVPACGAIAVVLSAVPLLSWTGNGQWHLPASGAEQASTFGPSTSGSYRVLWAGAASGLPLAAQAHVGQVSLATSQDGLPAAYEMWAPSGPGPARLLARDVSWALTGRTTNLAQLLGPFSVRYLVVQDGSTTSALVRALERQPGLVPLNSGPGYSAFSNPDWLPVAFVARAAVPVRPSRLGLLTFNASALVGRPLMMGPAGAAHADLPARAAGPQVVATVPAGELVAQASGLRLQSHPVLGSATAWELPRALPKGSSATVSVGPSGKWGRRVVDLLMLAVWAGGVLVAITALRARWRLRMAVANLGLGSPADQGDEIDWSDDFEGERVV